MPMISFWVTYTPLKHACLRVAHCPWSLPYPPMLVQCRSAARLPESRPLWVTIMPHLHNSPQIIHMVCPPMQFPFFMLVQCIRDAWPPESRQLWVTTMPWNTQTMHLPSVQHQIMSGMHVSCNVSSTEYLPCSIVSSDGHMLTASLPFIPRGIVVVALSIWPSFISHQTYRLTW